jgi:G3E family GTPase
MNASSLAIPVTVLSGYLGAGKTTLVNHLLRNAQGQKLAILVNEFGALPIDEDLIEATEDEVISIAGGCVCCSFGNDLTAALSQLVKVNPLLDHILIEASGVAMPEAIMNSVGLLSDVLPDGIVILADAETIQKSARDKYMSDTILAQLKSADLLILNKVDLVTEDQAQSTSTWLGLQNETAQIIPVIDSKVPPEIVLGHFSSRTYVKGVHHDVAGLSTLTLMPKHQINVDELAQSLATDYPSVVRAKGFATNEKCQKILIQVVGSRFRTSIASKDLADGIVCLGFGDALRTEHLQNLLHLIKI